METDSRVGPLPLADALIAWSDPALVDAIRVEEAKFAPGRLEELDHYTLADVRTLRRRPDRMLSAHQLLAQRHTTALDQAWERLFAAFRLRVERGEIDLRGTRLISIGTPEPAVLPREQAAAFNFDPPASAVKIAFTIYVGVTATRSADVAEVGPPRPRKRELPLAEALFEWGDAELVRQISELQVKIDYLDKQPQTSPEQVTTLSGAKWAQMDNTLSKKALDQEWSAAQKRLIEDLRRKIGRGDLELAGVQTFPLRETKRKPIPGAWAADFWFDLAANKIDVVQFNHTTQIYNAVTVSGPPVPSRYFAEPSSGPSDRPNKAEAYPLSREAPAPSAAKAGMRRASRAGAVKRKSGRKDSKPIIEAAVHAHWEHIKPSGTLPHRVPVWTEKARTLIKHMRRAAAKGGPQELLEFNTVRKHLPGIYRRVLSEKAADAKSDQ